MHEIVPKLEAFSLNEIAKATGLSLAACLTDSRWGARPASVPLGLI